MNRARRTGGKREKVYAKYDDFMAMVKSWKSRRAINPSTQRRGRILWCRLPDQDVCIASRVTFG